MTHFLFLCIILCAQSAFADPSCPAGLKPWKNETTGEYFSCDDINEFCPFKNFDCILDEENNSSASGVCCPNVAAMPPKTRMDGCPLGSRPYRNSFGQLVTCYGDLANTCPNPERTLCYKGGAFGSICCAADTASCPVGYETFFYPGTALPLVCGTTGTCPFSYQCIKTSLGGLYECCRLRQASTGLCPTGFQPYLNSDGTAMSCYMGSPIICPTPSVCLASPNLYQSYCCTQDTPQQSLQCPRGYTLPRNGVVVPCIVGRLLNQCPSGSECKPSITVSGGICCRPYAMCPSGYEETLNSVTQEILECTGSSGSCPAGASCQLSVTTAGKLCCTPTSISTQCPSGYHQVTAIVSPCTTDSQCPNGARCVQSICCTSTTRPQCPSGYTALTDQTNWPVTCSSIDRWCPVVDATCLQSTTTSEFLCCTNAQQSQCPAGMIIILFAGQPIICDSVDTKSCPPDSTCQLSTVGQSRICCQSSLSVQPQCPRGLTLVLTSDNKPMFCSPPACATTSTCERATNVARDVCCKNDAPIGGNRCPTGYRIQRDTSNRIVTCDPTINDPCTNFGFCLPAVSETGSPTSELICCEPLGIQCPPRFNRLPGTTMTTCDASSFNPCSNLGQTGLLCLGGVGTGVASQRPFLCCQRSPLCINGHAPFYDENYQPKQCVINRPNECHASYRCEISPTAEGVSICCPKTKIASVDDDGNNELIDKNL